jgi:tRNA-dihydrouridine synthase
MKNYLDNLPRPFLVLAPMEDVTDTVFRRMIVRHAPFDLYFTEFVNVDGLQSPGRHASIRRLKFEAEEQPLIAQIWGADPENYYKTTRELVEMGFVGVDINMGCPAKDVVKKGCGGGMIGQPERAVEIIQAVKEAAGGKLPVSVKTRIGLKEYTPSWLETVLGQDLNMLTVHLRTVKEMSLVPAHWELMTEIRQLRDRTASRTALVGNGDVRNRRHAMELAAAYGIDGVMIGRGVFHDPFAAVSDSPWAVKSREEKLAMYREHVELFREAWQEDYRPIAPLNKFCKTYINGFPGAKEVRERLMHCRSSDELLQAILLETEQQIVHA